MKKTLLLTLMLLVTASTFAVEVEIDGLWYEVVTKAKGAKVIQYKNNIKYSGNIVIPETVEYNGVTCSVTSIEESAFYDCSGLISVTIPNGVTRIEYGAFYYCRGLTSVTIPNSVRSIGERAFYYCRVLTSVRIPNSVTSIGDYAFAGCSGLSSVTIGNSVTSIGYSAFCDCSGLASVTIPNSVTRIEGAAFYGCSSLVTITIGDGIESISWQVFAKCPELTDVYCYAKNVPSTITDAFEDSYIGYATLHVPTTSIDAYKAAEPWRFFKNFVGLNGTLPDTPDPELPKCATPTMAIKDGKLVFDCETEGVEYNCTITAADAKKLTGKEIDLAMTYKISVYASKADYEDSDIVTQEIKLFNGMRGDVNEDGVIDVADVVGVVNIILEKGDVDASRTREKLRENGFVF